MRRVDPYDASDSDAANGCAVAIHEERLGSWREFSLVTLDDGSSSERMLRYRDAGSVRWLYWGDASPDDSIDDVLSRGEV